MFVNLFFVQGSILFVIAYEFCFFKKQMAFSNMSMSADWFSSIDLFFFGRGVIQCDLSDILLPLKEFIPWFLQSPRPYITLPTYLAGPMDLAWLVTLLVQYVLYKSNIF